MTPLPWDQALEIWERRYQNEMKGWAHKFSYLHPFKSWEDLYQDLYVEVFAKLVEEVDLDRPEVQKMGVESVLDSMFRRRLGWYITKLIREQQTRRMKSQKEEVPLDQPLGEEGGDTIGDIIGDPTSSDFEEKLVQSEGVQTLLNRLPDNLRLPLQYIIDNFDGRNLSQVWEDINFNFGITKERLLRDLREEPDLFYWLTETVACKYHGKLVKITPPYSVVRTASVDIQQGVLNEIEALWVGFESKSDSGGTAS